MKITCFLIFVVTFLRVQAQADSLLSAVYSWENATVQKRPTGESRNLFKGGTRDLRQFTAHTSTPLEGLTNHPPVAYNDREELVIIKKATLKQGLMIQ